jgi:DNA-binding Lrp family transcriptional regulator
MNATDTKFSPAAVQILAALRADTSGLSQRDVADATGLGFSTVGNLLRDLENDGIVTREKRGVRRTSMWSLSPNAIFCARCKDMIPADEVDMLCPESADGATHAIAAEARPTTDAERDAATWLDARHAEAVTMLPVHDAGPYRDPATGEPIADNVVELPSRGSVAELRAVIAEAEADGPVTGVTIAEAPERRETALPVKARGELRADVLGWFTANPETEQTPAKLGKILGGRSSGAILKGCEKLVTEGTLVRTSEAPRTYRLA